MAKYKIDDLIVWSLNVFCRDHGMQWKVHAMGGKHVKVMIYDDNVNFITNVAGSSGDWRAGKNFVTGLKHDLRKAIERAATKVVVISTTVNKKEAQRCR